MAIDMKLITQLRDQTGAGIGDIKAALDEAGGKPEEAVQILRKKGAMKAAKKTSERTTGDGIIESYIHQNGRVGTLLELRCETDFVARTKDFKALAHEIALQIAGAMPLFVSRDQVPPATIDQEKEIYNDQLKNEGKPEKMWEKIIAGKLEKYYAENCLLEQAYIKDDTKTIGKLIEESIAKLGEKIEVGQFVRFQL